MTDKIIEHWTHKPGRHCASTALSDLMHFYGYELSEAACFGTGEGLAFWYMEGLKPSRMMHYRSADIEKKFFENIGVEFTWHETDREEDIKQTLITSIDTNTPVLLRTDIFYLDYYKSKTHFPGHAVVLWGYNLEQNIAFISDTERKGLTRCGFGSLIEGIIHGNFPEGEHAHFAPVPRPDISLHTKKLFATSAGSNARSMLAPGGFEGYGIKGMQLASKKVLAWKDLPDWAWLARFAYQVIEKRGTGGGAFRKMYADFLEGFAGKKAVTAIRQIASRWTDIALVFKDISEAETADFTMVSDMLWIQALKEEEFYKSIQG